MEIKESHYHKTILSSDYNYRFHKGTGYFIRWGKTPQEDPDFAPAPEIADIEVTTICNGINGKVCKHCYKSNTPNGSNMSLETFKKVFDKLKESNVITQIAFGAGSHADENPKLLDMMWYARLNGVIPNITVAQLSDDMAKKLAEVCGAVAVSRYSDKNICYDTVEKLISNGLKQVNIHLMVSEETYDMALETINDRITDSRLAELKAIVLLSLKKKGRGKTYNRLSEEKFNDLVQLAYKNNIGIGFDSCSAFKFLNAIKDREDFDKIEKYVEPCESSLFSIFINWKGEAFPCSFSDGCVEWQTGIDVVNCNNFIKDIWNNNRFLSFRKTLLESKNSNCFKCRTCPLYEV